jgi:probable phosphoglycerate mutase
MPERRYTFVRHGATDYNGRGLLNGDPRVPVGLTAKGRVAAAELAAALAPCSFDLALHTRFARTRETLNLLLAGRRDVPIGIEPGFDDIGVGEFEGRPFAEYRAWRERNGPALAVTGGESRLGALARYAGGCARLLATTPCSGPTRSTGRSGRSRTSSG